MKQQLSRYWACQLFGWGLFTLFNLLVAFYFDKLGLHLITRLLVFVGIGITMTHLMRYAAIRSDAFRKAIPEQLLILILITATAAVIGGGLETLLTHFIQLRTRQELSMEQSQVLLSNLFPCFVYYFMWLCIYLMYYYIQKSRKDEIDVLKLQDQLKELNFKR